MAAVPHPSNDFVGTQVKTLVPDLYSEPGYSVGEDGFVVEKRAFKTILRLPNKQGLMDKVQRRHDCCDRLKIKTRFVRPIPTLVSWNIMQLKDQLKSIPPTHALHDA